MNKMPSNITKAFKNKSALRKMADGGRLRQEHAQGIDRMLMGGAPAQDIIAASQDPIPQSAPVPMGATNQNPMGPAAPPAPDPFFAGMQSGVQGLSTPEGLAAFNERQGALNSGIEASVGEGGVPLLTGSPEFKTDPTAPALTPSLTPMPDGALVNQAMMARHSALRDAVQANLDSPYAHLSENRANVAEGLARMGDVGANMLRFQPGSSPGQTTTSPVAAAPPSAAPAPAAISPATPMFPEPIAGVPQQPVDVPMAPPPEVVNPVDNRPMYGGQRVGEAPAGLRQKSSFGSRLLDAATGRNTLDSIFKKPGMRSGGKVRGPGGPTEDKVGPVMLSDGEYVLPTDTAQAIGYENLDAIKDATHAPTKGEKKGLRKMAGGGAYYVDPRGQVVGQQSASRALAIPQQAGVPMAYPDGSRAVIPMPQPTVAGAGAVPPQQPAGPGRGFTGGYTPPQGQSAAPAQGLRGAGGLGLGVGAAVEGLRGYNDYQTLRGAGEEGAIAPQIAAEGLTRVAAAGVGAKLGAMAPGHPYVKGAAALGLGGLGFVAPDAIAKMTGHETANSRANKIRNQNAEDMRASGTLEDGTPAENAPGAGQGFIPSQMMYSDGTPYLADPGRASLRREDNSIPSNARDINRRFDSLAEELRGIHGSSVTTPFGRRRLDRSRELLDLEKARAQALSGDQNAMVNQRGHDISSRDAAAGRAARAASGSAEMNASMLREMRQAENDQRERMEKAQETLWAEAERMTSDNDDFSSRELYDFMLQSEGFMDDFASASPQQRRQMIAQMKDAVAEDRAQRARARRLGVAHDPGLIEPKGLQRGVRWGDVTNDRATFLRDFVGGNLRGRQYVDYDNMLVPLDDIARQNPDMRGLTNAQILRRLGADQ